MIVEPILLSDVDSSGNGMGRHSSVVHILEELASTMMKTILSIKVRRSIVNSRRLRFTIIWQYKLARNILVVVIAEMHP